MQLKKSMYDILICIGVFAFLSVFLVQLGGISKDAKGYPTFLLLCSALLTGALLVKSIKKYHREQATDLAPDFKQSVLLIILYAVLTAAYIFFLDKIGYIIATLLFVVISLLFLKVRNWKLLVLLPLGLTFSMYFLFTKFLLVTLPRGAWMVF